MKITRTESYTLGMEGSSPGTISRTLLRLLEKCQYSGDVAKLSANLANLYGCVSRSSGRFSCGPVDVSWTENHDEDLVVTVTVDRFED
jgi:hypothetical protein